VSTRYNGIGSAQLATYATFESSREALLKTTIVKLICIAAAAIFTLGGMGSFCKSAFAQPPAAKSNSSKPATPKLAAPSAADDLALRQDKLASKYNELEKLLLRMAEYESASNPRRSAVLKQAATQSSDHLTKAKLAAITKLLNSQQFKKAIDSQTEVQADLKLLLALLQSENENANRKSEQQKIKEYIKEIQRLARLQGSLKARTEQTDDPKALSKEQSSIADQAGKVKQDIAEEGEQAKPEDAQPSAEGEKQGDPKSQDKSQKDSSQKDEAKPTDPKEPGKEKPEGKQEDSKGEQKGENGPGEEKSQAEKGKEGEKTPSPTPPGEQKPSESKESQPGKGGKDSPMPQEGEQQPAPPQEQQAESAESPPAKKRVEAAEKKMREAQKKLEQAKRDEAVKDQQKAEEELKKAVAELEEILKQLREEEIEQTLADLATRFRKMLEMQLKVNESTVQLTKIPTEKRGREVDLQSTRLSTDQQKNLREAEKALALLGDEGSSTAFPASVEQLCQDMQQIVERLALVKIDSITVGIEEEVVQTLEQLIAALEQEQKEREKKKQEEKESPAPEQQPGEDPLIDRIAELKMIRSLQQRINKRTQTYSKLLIQPDDPVGQANTVDLEAALLQLSKREAEVFRVTRDIVVGRKQ
jgi:hypothetical protein